MPGQTPINPRRYFEEVYPELEAAGLVDEGLSLPTPFSVDPLNPLLVRAKWGPVTDDGWEMISPVVNLASAMLACEASVIFFYSLINAEPRRDAELSQRLGRNIVFIRRLDPYATGRPINEVREEYYNNLETIARDIQLRFERRADNWAAKPYHAKTGARYELPISFSNHARKNIEGYSAKVRIQAPFLMELYTMCRKQPRTPEVMASILRHRFWLACIICHELAHAVGTAIRPVRTDTPESIWEDHQIPELGRVREQEVFGGCLSSRPGKSYEERRFLTCEKWPHYTTPSRLADTPKTRAFKDSSTRYVVPMPYIRLLSSMEFWRDNSGKRDPKLLFCPKMIGIRIKNPDQEVDPLWDKAKSSETRYPNDDRMVVRRPWEHQIPELKEWFRLWNCRGKKATGDASPTAASGADQTAAGEKDQEAVLEGSKESISMPYLVRAEDLDGADWEF